MQKGVPQIMDITSIKYVLYDLSEKEEAINRRLSRANYEIASSGEFDFVLTNHDVNETVKGVFKIIKS